MVPRTKDDRTITAAGLARLLARLHPDAEPAAQEYERLRRTLVRFFDWRGVWPPDECADEALDRLARRLEENTAVDDIRSYSYGIARMVLLERRRQPSFTSIDDTRERASAPTPSDQQQRLDDCLERCLAEFPAENRSLVVDYYRGERQSKIANRRRLATTLGLSDNALRSRVQRLRDRLEACLRACCEEPS